MKTQAHRSDVWRSWSRGARPAARSGAARMPPATAIGTSRSRSTPRPSRRIPTSPSTRSSSNARCRARRRRTSAGRARWKRRTRSTARWPSTAGRASSTRPTASPPRRSTELEKTIRDRIEATRPKPQIDTLRDKARAMGQPLIDLTTRLPSLKFNNASLRDILNFIGTQSGINITYEPTFQRQGLYDRARGRHRRAGAPADHDGEQHVLQGAEPQDHHGHPGQRGEPRRSTTTSCVRAFYISHADVAELTQLINSMMRITTMPVQPAVLPNKTANTITVRATERRSSRSSSGSSAPTTSRAPKS